MADALRVDVGERAEQLVDVELDLEDGHDRLHLVEVARGAVDSLGHKLEDEVEVHFILLWLDALVIGVSLRVLQTRTRSPLL
jgi:hypothetical protein